MYGNKSIILYVYTKNSVVLEFSVFQILTNKENQS